MAKIYKYLIYALLIIFVFRTFFHVSSTFLVSFYPELRQQRRDSKITKSLPRKDQNISDGIARKIENDSESISAAKLWIQNHTTHEALKANNITGDSNQLIHIQQEHVSQPGNLSNSTIYFCGYEQNVKDLYEHIYPEFRDRIKNATAMDREKAQMATEQDILLNGSGGDCGWGKLKGNWLEKYFKGTVIIINGENWAVRNTWKNLSDISTIPKNQYHVGHIGDGCQSRRIYFIAQAFLWRRELWQFFLHKTKKQRSTKERFLIYINGNCVDFREKAFDAIAVANPSLNVEYGGACSGNIKNLTNVVKSDFPLGRKSYLDNWKKLRKYRFCLVMENSYVEGYITEKILNAYAAGCIPIYYGTTEIFDIFNPKSFIYYNIHNPEDALDKIARLEGNASLYKEVMEEPILLEGNMTIQKYFSLSDEIIPDAYLKKELRQMLYIRCQRDEKSVS